jgi:prolipoprotein diacylglyceryltransferase
MEKTLPFLLLAEVAFNIITLMVILFFWKRNHKKLLGDPTGIAAIAYGMLIVITVLSLVIITHQDRIYMISMVLPFLGCLFMFRISGNGNPILFLNEDQPFY